MYEMLLNYRHGNYHPIGTLSALSDVSKDDIADGLRNGYFRWVETPKVDVPPKAGAK